MLQEQSDQNLTMHSLVKLAGGVLKIYNLIDS